MQVSDPFVASGPGGTPGGSTAHATDTERAVADIVAEVLELDGDGVRLDADLFDDLGADSLLAAEVCTRLRSHPDVPGVSIKDVYQHPSVAGLSLHLQRLADELAQIGDRSDPTTSDHGAPTPPDDRPVTTVGYWLCGTLQCITLLGLTMVTALLIQLSFDLVTPASGWWDTYLRAIAVGAALFVTLAVVPIAAKWLIIGRWKPRTIRLWSLGYYRFWLGRLVARANPLVLFAGSPIYTWYLRALGARIGPGTVVLSRQVPACTDLLTIGARSVIRESSSFSCYRAVGRHIEIGPVTIGNGAFVGEGSVLDVGARLGDRAQLAHASSVAAGQEVPADAHVVGVPATTPLETDFTDLDERRRGRARRAGYSLFQLTLLFAVSIPVATSIAMWFLEWRSTTPPTGTRIVLGAVDVDPLRVLAFAGAIFGGLIVLRLVSALLLARLLSRLVRPDEVYPTFGVRYLAHRTIRRITNVRFFTEMLGDSSYIIPYFRALGYDVTSEDQTGANFGQTVVHDDPYLVSVGKGTMAADNLTMPNARYSSTSFSVTRVDIGPRSFFGNQIIFPAGATVGENCLLASKVAVPVEGDVRTDTGLLGSPTFEIPRQVFRDRGFEERRQGPDFHNTLSKKNAHNRRSMGWFLLYRFVGLLGAVAVAFGATDVFDSFGAVGVFVGLLLVAALVPIYRAVVEWASIGFRRMRPMQLSIYDRQSWKIERFWKLSREPRIFNGTPLKAMVWRMHGVRVGKRLFDDGTLITDKTMTSIGDDCALNNLSVLQAHSQEDGSFKSDDIHIASGCTVGVGALVHYGVTLGDRTVIDANAFVMKGTVTPDSTRWGENPARELGPVQTATPPIAPSAPPTERQDRTMTMHLDSTPSTNGSAPPAAVEAASPDEAERFWRDELLSGGSTPIPRWTTDASAPDIAETNVLLPDQLAAALGELGRRRDIDLDVVVLAAHARVVATLTGEDDVVVGFAGRGVLRPLPCRLSVGDGSWDDLLDQATQRAADVERHGDVDLDALRDELNLPGDAFDSAVQADDSAVGPAQIPPLSVGLHAGVAGAQLVVRHRPAEFDTDTAMRFAGYHLRALEHLTTDPSEPARSRSVVSVAEIDHQIRELSGPHHELPDRRMHELFEDRAAAHPERPAVRHLDQEWTYAELNAHANEIAHALITAGVERESVVAVVTERNLGWMASALAIFKVGGVYLPVEPHFPAGRIEKTLGRAGCSVVLTETGSSETLDDALGSLPPTTRLVLDDLIGSGPTTNPGIEVDVDQLAYIYFTSGSTGEPKGAMCEHAGFLNHLYAKIDDLEIGEGEVVAQIAPQCFDISLWQLVSALLVGGTTVIIDQDTIMQPARFVDRIVGDRVGVMQVVPSYLEVVLTYLDHEQRDLGDLHCVSVTGEALTLDLAHRWFERQTGIKLANAYGLTETSDDTNHEVMREAPVGSVPLGPAVNNAVVYVLDQQLRPVPLGSPGEIAFSGVCVGRGYINDPERTAAAYLDDPLRPGERLYRSGDFGRWRPDGKLEYLGRRDAQVKIRGFRIEIGEIENVLGELDGVRRGAVVIVEPDEGNKQLVAFYSGTRHADDVLRVGLGRSLPEYMVPTAFHWRDELPLTDNGKIDRKVLRAEALDTATAEPGEFEPLRTETERHLAAHWSEILGIPAEQIGRRDHFFDRGGSSLSAVELVVALDNAVSLTEVTATPVLADLARVIDGEVLAEGGLLHRLSEPGHDRAIVVCLPYAGGNAVNFQSLAQSLRGSGVGLYAAELPGHQLTEDDEMFASIADAARRIAAEIGDLDGVTDRPVTLWGHSAGSALAVEVARRLRGSSAQLHSVIVAAQLPGDPAVRRAHLDHLCAISDRKIVTSMSAHTGYGDLDALDAEQTAHLGAALRHDVVGAHRWFIGELDAEGDDIDPIDVPLIVVAAADDTSTPDAADRHREWNRFGSHLDYREVASGGHFFIRTDPDLAASIVRETLLGDEPSETPEPPRRRSASLRASRSMLGRPLEIETPDGGIARTHVDGDPDPVAFAARHRDTLRGQLVRHGALLVRGLSFEAPDDVLAVAQIVSNGLLDDTEAFAPRERHVGHAFSPSAWPANQQMCVHHELSYRFTFPGLMTFTCLDAADSGGAVPIADAARVLDALPGELVARFEEQGWILSRNYTDEIGLSFEEAFGTSDRAAIETYCAENAIDAEWTDGGGLRTSQRRRAVVEHPVTGSRVWFNQIAFLNEWTLKPDVRELLVDMYGADGLPFTTRFGDGEPIGADVVETINAAYDECTIREPMERFDLLLVDNIASAHGRDPYEGDRDVVVTLGDPWNADVRVAAPRRSRRKAGAGRR